MMRSLFSGVSGLKNHQTRMDVIGNNISNVNTTGYKSSRVNFTDMLSQNLQGASSPNGNIGGTNPKQIGLGSSVGAVDLLFTNGSVQSTGVNTDLALSSTNALFILNTGTGTAYTRNGDFQFDADGNYVQAGNGYFVQGWMANNGTIDTGAQVTNITIPSGKTMAPAASVVANYTNNLNAEVPTITAITGGTVKSTDTHNYTQASDGTLTATTQYPVTVATADGGTITKADSSNPYETAQGSYKVDDPYSVTLSADGDKAQVSANNTITVAFAEGGSATATISGSDIVWTFTGVSGHTSYTQTGVNTITVGSAGQLSLTSPDVTLTPKTVTVASKITGLTQDYTTAATASADNAVTLTLSDGSKITQTSGVYSLNNSLPIVTTLSVYDSLGSVHDVAVYFTLTDAANDTWKVSLSTDDANPSTTSWTEADGSTTTVSMPVVTLDFDTNGRYASGSGNTELTLRNGSTTPQTVNIDFSNLTQYSSSSTIAGKADGNAAGTLSSVSIDKTGTITGTYTNGEKQVEAQVALQRFTNPGGLNKIGESLYEDSNNAGKSGEASTASALGATITPSALEMSNVDVANEFTDMIITQRGFQGNSKIITVSDEMLETLINMKR